MLLLGVVHLESLPFVGALVLAEEVCYAIWVVLGDYLFKGLMLLNCGFVELSVKLEGLVYSPDVFLQSLLDFPGLI